jgi:hypothetical protein
MIQFTNATSHQIKLSFILLILISNIGSIKRQNLNVCSKHLWEILIKIIKSVGGYNNLPTEIYDYITSQLVLDNRNIGKCLICV